MSFKQTFAVVREKAARAALWPAVMLASSPVWASSGKVGNLDLPAPPGEGIAGVNTGTWIAFITC